MRITFIVISIVMSLFFVGCSTTMVNTDSMNKKLRSIDTFEQNSNLEIPEVVGLSDIRENALEWKITFTGDVDGYRIYRADYNKYKPKYKLVRQINDRYIKHYVDTHLKPNKTYMYSMSTLKNGYESIKSSPIKLKTKRPPEPTNYIIAYSGMSKSIKIMWKPSVDIRVNGYLLEKYNSKYRKWEQLKVIKNRLSVEFIDTKLKDGTVYKYRLRSLINNRKIVGRPTKSVHAKTKPIPPIVENINITSKAKGVELTWDVADIKDVEYYKIYRIKDWQYVANTVLFKEMVGKTKDTIYIDELPNKNNDNFYYFVTAVDSDGVEGNVQSSPRLGYTLRKPISPSVEEFGYRDGLVKFKISSRDERDVYYRVYKKTNKKFFIFQETNEGFKGLLYEDGKVNIEYSYEYYFTSYDKYGIESKPSKVLYLNPRKGEF